MQHTDIPTFVECSFLFSCAPTLHCPECSSYSALSWRRFCRCLSCALEVPNQAKPLACVFMCIADMFLCDLMLRVVTVLKKYLSKGSFTNNIQQIEILRKLISFQGSTTWITTNLNAYRRLAVSGLVVPTVLLSDNRLLHALHPRIHFRFTVSHVKCKYILQHRRRRTRYESISRPTFQQLKRTCELRFEFQNNFSFPF